MGPKWYLAEKKSGTKRFWIHKDFGSNKNFWSKKMLGPKIFWSKIFWVQKNPEKLARKIWLYKNLTKQIEWKILPKKKIWSTKKLLTLVKKNWSKKLKATQKFPKNKVKSKKKIVPKHFGPKIFLSLKIDCPKIIGQKFFNTILILVQQKYWSTS